jgi:hypothetical protein
VRITDAPRGGKHADCTASRRPARLAPKAFDLDFFREIALISRGRIPSTRSGARDLTGRGARFGRSEDPAPCCRCVSPLALDTPWDRTGSLDGHG